MDSDKFLPWRERSNIQLPEQGDWEYLLDRLEEQFPHSLFRLSLTLADGALVAEGAVASVAARDLLTRMLNDHPKVIEFENRMEITAPFVPASASADPFGHLEAILEEEPAGDSVPRRETVVRFPSIEPMGDARMDELLTFRVDLGLEPDDQTEGGSTTIDDVPEDWVELEVEVHVHSAHLTFRKDAEIGFITLRNGKPSLPAVFSALVDPASSDLAQIQISATFFHKDRKCGWASRLVALVGRIEADRTPVDDAAVSLSQQSTGESMAPGVHIELDAAAPELTISIYKPKGLAEGSYLWHWRSIHGHGIGARNSAFIDLGKDTVDFSRDLLARCANLRPGQHEMTLSGIGTDIWDATPLDFREHYLGLRALQGDEFTIQIFSEEPHIPWEMMVPPPRDYGVSSDHLFMTHPVARWFAEYENQMPTQFCAGGITTFLPAYLETDLPGAFAEGKWLTDTFSSTIGVTAGEASYGGFTSFFCDPLPQDAVGVIHFAGHGDGILGQRRGLKMSNSDWVPADTLKHHGVTLGKRDKALVIINACEVGNTNFNLGVLDGWPKVLTKAGFAGVLSPIWAVQDEHASAVIMGTMPSFIVGEVTLAAAVTKARRENRKLSAAPYAYLLYGDVTALREA